MKLFMHVKHYALCYTIALFLPLLSNAQKEIPAFGKIDKADLEMTDCDFDKGAAAVKLIDWGNLFYTRGTSGISFFKTIYESRVRIKILKDKGLDQGNQKIRFNSRNGNEIILKFDAYTYNLDASGKIKSTEVTKSSIYTKKIDGDMSEMTITFPEVKVGSIIEYKYRMERETIGLMDWVFQERIPVRYSEYQLTIPSVLRFTAQESVIDPLQKDEKVIRERITVDEGIVETNSLKTNYIMRNLPGIPNEPYMGSVKDYVQRVEFQLTRLDFGDGQVQDLHVKWSDAIDELLKSDYFGKQLDQEIPGTAGLVATAKTIKDPERRTLYIYNQLRGMMRWNEDDNILTDKGIKPAWDSKTGNTADINLLLIKLLRAADIDAKAGIFSTRDNGIVNTSYPFNEQFNTVMAVVYNNGKNWILDATDKFSNAWLTPERIVNTKGFIVEAPSGKFIDVVDVNHKYKIMSAIQGEIDADGMMKGDGTINCRDYARKVRCEDWSLDKETFKKKYFTVTGQAVKIDEVLVNNADQDSLPLEQKVKFTVQLNGSGDYKYFTANLFSGMDKNPFIIDDRVTDVDFGYLKDYTIFGNFLLPQGYTFEDLPKDISLVMPDNSIEFNRNMQADGNIINVRISVQYKRTFYPASQYPEFKEFHKKLFNALEEQIVIKKKS